MIKALFSKNQLGLCGFSISGHAMFDDYGRDIVCASVTSATQLTCNAITEILGVKATVNVLENEIKLTLPKSSPKEVVDFLDALFLHLEILSEEYKGTIKLKVLEVQQQC